MNENAYLPDDRDRPEGASARYRSLIAGGVLILLGLIFFLQNFGALYINNWWALFILIPSFTSFATAWAIYERNGRRLTPAARGPLIGGVTFLTVAAIFLLGLNWGVVWPVFLIIAGLSALLWSRR